MKRFLLGLVMAAAVAFGTGPARADIQWAVNPVISLDAGDLSGAIDDPVTVWTNTVGLGGDFVTYQSFPTLKYTITFDGLTGPVTGVDIHATDDSVLITLDATNLIGKTISITQEQADAIRAGGMGLFAQSTTALIGLSGHRGVGR